VAKVKEAVSAAGHVIVDMADFPASDRSPAQLCTDRVRGCEVYVGVFGTRYGSLVRDRPDVSYTELEFDIATEAGLDRLVFLLDTDAADVGIPLSKLIDHEFGARQDAFRRRVQDSGLVTQSFADPAALGQLVERSLQGLARTRARINSGVAREQAGAIREVPRQLPASVADFTGRPAEMRMLTEMLDQARPGAPGTLVISAIGGTAGVGKTALALHWAHQVAARFGDGQLYANLRGFDPSGAPTAPAEAIRGFLDALGVPPGRIPLLPEAQTGLYRSLLADRKMLIVLDNARDEQQVRPLLPASPGSLVLVTSRSQLSGLAAADGARLISLDVLSHAEAVDMLTARLGTARAAAQPGAVDRIAGLCACLPLALAVAAARAADRPGFPLAVLADELADSAQRLDALDADDPGSNVRAVFSWSTQQLTGEAAQMFRLLGIHPGPDIGVPAAASLAGKPEAAARHLLHELARAHLIAENLPGRYAFHDLLRAYAAEQAKVGDGQAERDAAVSRVLLHYLHTAHTAALLLSPPRDPIIPAQLALGVNPEHLTSYQQALEWFEAERGVLLASVRLAALARLDRLAWQLAWAMQDFLDRRGHWHDWGAVQRIALDAATRLGDPAGQAVAHRLVAAACYRLTEYEQARVHLMTSLGLYRQLGDRLGEARIYQSLSIISDRQGNLTDALSHDKQALSLFRAIGHRSGQAYALNSIGWSHTLLGDPKQGRLSCQESLALHREVGDRAGEAHAWDSLGFAEHHLGNLTEAAACYQRALNLQREAGYRIHEAESLTHLGDTHHAAGELAQAWEAWQQALAILEDLQHPDADQVRTKLADTNDQATP
jgi:tetratricopeptide (TPR) repeat protein